MAVCARRSHLPPRALELARRLADRPGLVVLGPGFGLGARYVACDPIAEAFTQDPEPALGVDSTLGPHGTAPRWVGLLPYEACRHLERCGSTRVRDERPAPPFSVPRWLRYAAVAIITDHVLIVGDDQASVDRLARWLDRPERRCAVGAELVGAEPAQRHAERIRVALRHIAAGDVYQVNLARRFDLALRGATLEHFAALERAAPAPYGFSLSLAGLGCAGSSPELFLRTTVDGRVLTAPIKGTRPRGTDAASDAALLTTLDGDPKERAELVMVIDLERNDLGRVSAPGSVRVAAMPHVVTHPTVHHRLAVVVGRIRDGTTRGELLAAMLPSGSVTGAPKVRAMELIAALEAHRRGLYTGAYGVLRRDGTLTLAMAIRTLVRDGEVGHYFAGGGIVADSDPEREVLETAWKARQLAALWEDGGARGVAGPGDDRRKLVRFLPER
ncbi:MAG: anthranilate synthase component I family protein [Polyangiaceae bacterium]|nr:anthranilate synthase component I family protein [Polyangiaceae bacterium]